MITVIYIKNPFDLSSKESILLDYIPKNPIKNYIKQVALFDENTISISINGHISTDFDAILEDGDYVIMCPKVEDDVLGFLASIALTYVAFGVGGWASGAGWGATVSTWGTGATMGYLAAAAVLYVGGQLLTPSLNVGASEWESSPTYSWNPQGNLMQQGAAIPITFGRTKITGQVISRRIETIDDKQYLYLLVSGGEGEVEHIGDLEINGTPISYFEGIEIDHRVGRNDQSVMPTFSGKTYADLFLSYELDSNGVWHTHRTEGNAGDGLQLTFECPNGLYYANDNGGLSEATVKISAQYKRADETTWKNFFETKPNVWSDSKIPDSLVYFNNLGGINEVWTFTGKAYTISYIEDDFFPMAIKFYHSYAVVGSVSGQMPDLIIGQDYNNGKISLRLGKYSYYAYRESPPPEFFTMTREFTLTLQDNSELAITGATNSPIRKTLKIDGLNTGQYDVRTMCSYKSGKSNRYSTRVFWTQLTHTMSDQFAYPNIVLVGVKALATGQLSGSVPTVSWIQGRNGVYVWNPIINSYEYLASTNPAWACYDMLHRARKIKRINDGVNVYDVRGIEASRLKYDEFKAWADFCDRKGLTVNMFFDVGDGLWEQLAHIEMLGRGKVVFRGTRMGCIFDDPTALSKQLFTVSNIYSDSFSEDFLTLNNRANAVDITFTNKDNNYTQEVTTVYGKGFDTTDKIINKASLTLYGCNSREQAIKEGRYLLSASENLFRTVSIEVDVDSIACQVGDIIDIQHDVPQWGVGGRILSYSVSREEFFNLGVVRLDKKVILQEGKTYRLLTRFINNGTETLQDVAVLNPNSIYDVETDIIFVSPFSVAPQQYEIFSFGEVGKITKKFKVMDITRSKDMKRKINAIEYVPAVFDETNIPDLGAYVSFPEVISPINVSASPTFTTRLDRTVNCGLNVRWDIARNTYPTSFLIFMRSVNVRGVPLEDWKFKEKGYGNSHSIYNLSPGFYDVGVSAVYNEADYSSAAIINLVNLTEWVVPPPDVSNFIGIMDTVDKDTINFSWDRAVSIDLKEYQIRKGDSWDSGTLILTIPNNVTTANYTAKYKVTTTGYTYYHIKTLDSFGNYSLNSSSTEVFTGDSIYPENVTGFDVEQLI